MIQDSVDSFLVSLRNSQLLRLCVVGFLVLVLHIPIAMIGGLISERQMRSHDAVMEVSGKWGRNQTLTGPALVVPYEHRWTETGKDGQKTARSENRSAIFLPESLRVRGTIDSEVRRRGIFTVPVYRLDLDVEGVFQPPRFDALGIDPAEIAWERAYLAIGISDARAIQEETRVTWGDRTMSFLPGTGDFLPGSSGIQAVVGATGRRAPVAFSFPLRLNGTRSVHFTPFGQNTSVELASDYAHPSFQGNWLPAERSVSAAGFDAHWSIPFLGRSYPQAWPSEADHRPQIDGSRFGVELVDPVDHYRMAERSVKYAGLFILLTFATLWLVEVLAQIRVHPIQYLMLGGALCLFFLLELSLSEHLGFLPAYGIACLAVVGMVAAYGRAVLQHGAQALGVATGVALLYAYLYVLLLNEDYALLIGSVGLFAILAAIMFATRGIDWYAMGSRPRDPGSP